MILDNYTQMKQDGKYSFRREFGENDSVMFTFFEYDSRTGKRTKIIKKRITSDYIQSKINEAYEEIAKINKRLKDLELAYTDCKALEDQISPK